MQNSQANGSRAVSAWGFAAVWVVLAMGLCAMPSRAKGAPFAYVTNIYANTVSVIDTATNTVVATVPVEKGPQGVAVTPDGTRAYVANTFANTVSVLDTATNRVITTVKVGVVPIGVAVTPDGRHVYVTNGQSNNVSVIDTVANSVMATVPVGLSPDGVAVTPDGHHIYVSNSQSNTISVINTITSKVVAVVKVGVNPEGVAVTPDGQHIYVANLGLPLTAPGNTVSVIATATNEVVATVEVGINPSWVAVTPDGSRVYVANAGFPSSVSVIATASNKVVTTVRLPGESSPFAIAITPNGKHAYVPDESVAGAVSVIDTTTNTVVATVPVGSGALGVGIIPDLPFLAFKAHLDITFDAAPNHDSFALKSSFILSGAAPEIDPLIDPVTLQVGTFALTFPPRSFKVTPQGNFIFSGVIDGANLEALIEHTGTMRYEFQAKAVRASLTGTTIPATVRLSIGNDSGITLAKAKLSHY